MTHDVGATPDRPVLVTGSHRSGTTWVGRLLAASERLHYVQEPFNIVARQRWLSPRAPHQFLYISDENGAQWDEPLTRVFDLKYPLVDHLRQRPGRSTAKRMTRIAFEARRAARSGAVALVKDPIALFSTPWLRRRFDVRAVALVRDPIAFVGSLKEQDWAFDFRHWLDQPALMADLLADDAACIESMVAAPRDIVEQGIVQWNAMYRAVDRFRTADQDVIVVRYEALAADPLVEVEGLYRRLGFAFGERQRRVVGELTTSSGTGSSAIDVRRNSRQALQAGKQRLSDDEIKRVREGTADVAALFAH